MAAVKANFFCDINKHMWMYMRIFTPESVISPRNVLDRILFDKKGGALFVFDVDDTILNTSAKIIIKKVTGQTNALTSAEYGKYTIEEGDQIDLSQFSDSYKFVKESKPISKMLSLLKSVQRKVQDKMFEDGSRLILLTARNDFDSKHMVLEFVHSLGIDIDLVHIERAGRRGVGSTGKNKHQVLSEYLERNNFASVVAFDDSVSNLEAIASLSASPKEPYVQTFHVDEGGYLTLHREEGRRERSCTWATQFCSEIQGDTIKPRLNQLGSSMRL
ncbi:hypothetical protein CL689_06080 [Candidatus Saccharibacteria bacterium]|nr:hypothetical protein [Candidatus Saccharibacteria bacterium]|tara:strand:- start:4035 stop:4856 length:822 start_codon:yes stop_codon:yes gene_type:complete